MLAVEYQKQIHDLGLRTFPLAGKKPLPGYHWKERAGNHPVPTESYGVCCDEKIAVIDCDTRERAVWWWENRPRTPFMVKTPRGGVHYIYPGEAKNRQYEDFDIRGNGGYVCGVGSVIAGKVYELVNGGRITLEAPQFSWEWVKQWENRKAPQETWVEDSKDRIRLMTRARAYLLTVEGAVSGQRGHDKTLYAACCLLHKFNLTVEEAWPIMLEYNQRCAPPWSEKDLLRKLNEADRINEADYLRVAVKTNHSDQLKPEVRSRNA